MGQMSKRRDHIPSWFCPSFCEDTPLKNNTCWKIIFRHLISRSLTLINQQMYMSSSFILRSSQINELIESRAFGSMTRPQRNQEQTGCDDIHPMSSAEITRGARGLHSITHLSSCQPGRLQLLLHLELPMSRRGNPLQSKS